MKRVLSMVLSLLMIVSMIPSCIITANAASSCTLYINWDDIKGVGHQTPYTSACACFAVAYCRTILDGEIHSWSEYDLNGGAKGQSGAVAQWSKGKYTTSAKSTVNATLKAVYDQINNGRPAILHVKGGRSTGQHWVAVVGYQNVSNENSLTYDNFLIIDSVASKYEIENLGALGYKLKETSGKGYRYAYTASGSVSSLGSSTNNATYSFNFNANGGTLGSTGAFSVSYGDQFQVLNTTCTRSGYIWAGWNVKRNNDNKWYVDGQGWCTDSQITSNGYIKKAYGNYQTCKLDDSWTSGISGDCSYTFYAVWIQSRVDMLKVFLSPYGKGYDHITALNNIASSGFTQEQIYVWYVLCDQNTGDLMNTYSNKTYSVKLSIYDPKGDLVHDYTYANSSDANWIGITPRMSGTYTATATISGAYSGSISTTYEVSYDAQLSSSHDSISLDLNGTNSVTPTVYISGSFPGNYGVKYEFSDSSIASAAWSGNWNGNSTTITITGKKYGSTNLTLSVYENYTGNKNIVATVTIPVFVDANSYVVSYNANGGSGAPSDQLKYYGTSITLSSTVPTRSGYTFLGWSTSSAATSATYQPGSTFTLNADTTLYAVWRAVNNKPTAVLDELASGIDSFSIRGWAFDEDDTNANLEIHVYVDGVYAGCCVANTSRPDVHNVYGCGNYHGFSATIPYDVSSTGMHTVEVYAIDSNGSGPNTKMGSWQIEIEDKELPTSMSANSSNSAVISTGGEMKYYTFTPSTSGTYVIYSTGSDDTRVYLYDANGIELDSDDDDGEGYNFRLECNLTAGTTYTFGVRYYDSSKTDTISFKFGNVYTIAYNANGGSGVPSSQKKDYDTDVVLSSIAPTRKGYTFLGWALSQNADNISFQPGDLFSINYNVTLYAVWKQGCENGAHNYYNYTVAEAPTISASGTLAGLCADCFTATYVTLPKLSTADYDYSIRTAATCTEVGSGRYTWKTTTYGSLCFDVSIPVTGHNYTADPAVCGICDHVRASSEITSAVLRPNAAGIYFMGAFTVDADVQVARQGIVVSTSNALPVADDSDPSSLYTTSGVSVLVKDILKTDNTDAQNRKNAAMLIYARTYILLDDGTYIYGETVVVNLKSLVEAIDAKLDNLTGRQAVALTRLYTTYATIMESFNLPNLKEYAGY